MLAAAPTFRGRFALVSAWMLVATFVAAGAFAQGATTESRVALVIGNAAYPAAPLRNPANDAKAIADRLRALGYDVTLRTNVSQREMTRAVSQFGQALKPGSVALFYYAGHGMQVRGRNFLVPIDAEIETEASVRSESVDLDLVLEQLGPARLGMVILDACRNNPFEGRFRANRGSGLAQIDAPKGTLLAYATAPGKVASDGEGSHGLYTAELLKAMDQPGIKVEEAFKMVRVNVIRATAGEQVPWESSSLTGDYYFRPVDKAAEEERVAREARARQADLQSSMQAKLETERRSREQEAQALKAEMEKLRQEVRRLSESSSAVPTSPPASGAARADVAAPKAVASPVAPPGRVPPQTAASAPSASQPAEAGAREWARRVQLIESQRGKLTYAKAMAILLAPLTDEQLLQLVEREKSHRDLPFNSATALGITTAGTIAVGRTWGEHSPALAFDTARERCAKMSRTPCSVVMANGEFREDAFIEWISTGGPQSILRIRNSLFGSRGELRQP